MKECSRRAAIWICPYIVLIALLPFLAGCDLTGQAASTAPTPTHSGSQAAPAATPAGRSQPSPVEEIGAGSAPTALTTPTVLPQEERLRIFDEVWWLVYDDYLYRDFHGVDWDKLYDDYRPQVLAASTAQQYYDAIGDMVAALKDDHSSYLSPWAAREEDGFMRGEVDYAGVGIYGASDEKSYIVHYVFPGSPADRAGIERRDRITAVDGVPVAGNDSGEIGIRGDNMTSVRLTVRSPGRSSRDVVVQRGPVTGKVTASSHLLEADPTIGYVVVPSLFVRDMGMQVETELRNLRWKGLLHDQPIRGLVIDLRGNAGGWFETAEGVLSQFMEGEAGGFFSNNSYVQDLLKEDELTDMQIDAGTLYDELRSLPVVVLVDEHTASAAEVVAAALQASGRARIVGTPSKGNTEVDFYYDLDDGSRLWLAQAAYLTPDGTKLEGRGVLPDGHVEVDWTDYTEADDPQILKAIELIRGADGQ